MKQQTDKVIPEIFKKPKVVYLRRLVEWIKDQEDHSEKDKKGKRQQCSLMGKEEYSINVARKFFI